MMEFNLCLHKFSEIWNLFSRVPLENRFLSSFLRKLFPVLSQATIYIFSFMKMSKRIVKYLNLFWYKDFVH